MESVVRCLIENAFTSGQIEFLPCPRGLDPVQLSGHFDQMLRCQRVHELFREGHVDQAAAERAASEILVGVQNLNVSEETEVKMEEVSGNCPEPKAD